MKIKTSDLSGDALNFAVATAQGVKVNVGFRNLTYVPQGKRTLYRFDPVTNWKQGGPIIERAGISLNLTTMTGDWAWSATCNPSEARQCGEYGPTMLTAGLRCVVAATLGDEVDVPRELVPEAVS